MDLRQNQLADMIGISAQHICHIENGSKLSLPVLVSIAYALGVEPGVLLGSNVKEGRSQLLTGELSSIIRNANPEKLEQLVKIAKIIME